MQKKRIISLLPAATEIICALDLVNHLVGRSHECDFPEDIKTLPICCSAKINPEAGSLEIDQKVKEILTASLSIYDIDKELIASLKPDLIITQAQCEVCAVSLKDVEESLSDFLNTDTQIISLQPNTLSDIFNDIAEIAIELNVKEKGEILIEDLNDRIDLVKHKLKFFPNKPKVANIEWLSPMMLAGNWMPELVNIAGGSPILTQNGKHSPFIEWQQIYDENPDIIIISPCGYTINQTLKEIDLLLNLPGWRDLAAVKNNRVYIADGNAYFNRSGPRVVDTIEMLAEMITPTYFTFGYEGQGWIKFES
jgi:iron complex transport system substrate-binding protein